MSQRSIDISCVGVTACHRDKQGAILVKFAEGYSLSPMKKIIMMNAKKEKDETQAGRQEKPQVLMSTFIARGDVALMGMARALKREGLIHKAIQSFKSEVYIIISPSSSPITIYRKEQLEGISPQCKQVLRKEAEKLAARRMSVKLEVATNKQLQL